MERVEAVVVGCGVVGAAAARALARRGREVVVLERFSVGHRRGSSHGTARIFRLSYNDPAMIGSALAGLRGWRELEAEAGVPLLERTGGLDLDPPPATAAALEACGVAHELLPGAEARRRFPGLLVPDHATVLYHADAGVIAADPAWRALARSARAHGAEVREGVRVEAVRATGEREAEVRADDEAYRARAVVVAAGAWAPRLLAGAGWRLPVAVTREAPAYFRTPDPWRLPVVVEAGTPARYALPTPEGLVKAAEHAAGPTADPEEDGRPDPRSAARVGDWVARRFGLEGPPASVETCLYTSTADERFIVERRGPLVVGSACSGHGFKHAPAVGERLADLATA